MTDRRMLADEVRFHTAAAVRQERIASRFEARGQPVAAERVRRRAAAARHRASIARCALHHSLAYLAEDAERRPGIACGDWSL